MSLYVEELSTECLISVPGCPEPIIERMLRSAMVEFYRDTQAWRLTTDPAPVRAGMREVEIDLPADTFITRVFWAKLDGELLTAISPRDLLNREGMPRAYSIDGLTRSVQLDVIPQDTYLRNGVTMNVALLPLPTLNDLDDTMFAIHRDGILYGALAKLLAMPNVPWTSLNDAGTYAAMAAGIRHEARRQADSLQAPVARKVRYGGI